jgi:hypothetical protein
MVLLLIGVRQVNAEEWGVLFIQVTIFQLNKLVYVFSLSIQGLYAGPVVGFFLGGIMAKYAGHYSIYYATCMSNFKYFYF